MGDEGQLNLEAANLENVTQGASRAFDLLKDGIAPVLGVALFIGCVVGAYRLLGKDRSAGAHMPTHLLIHNWPQGLKVALLPLLIAFGLTHVFSAASVVYNTTVANPSTLSYFETMGVSRLFSLSHAHLFAHATMYFLMALLVQFTGRGSFCTVWAPNLALWAGIFDVVSWWGLKKLSPNFEALSAVCGASFSVSFLVMAYAILSPSSSRRGGIV